MKDPVNVRSSIRGPDEKDRFEHYNSNSGPSSRLSRKFLTWGVETRGAYSTLNSELNHLDTKASSRIYGI